MLQEIPEGVEAGGSGPGFLQGLLPGCEEDVRFQRGLPLPRGLTPWPWGRRPQFLATRAAPSFAQCPHRAARGDQGGGSGASGDVRLHLTCSAPQEPGSKSSPGSRGGSEDSWKGSETTRRTESTLWLCSLSFKLARYYKRILVIN